MAHYNAAEVRDRYIAAMGANLGSVFDELVKECFSLHVKWVQYLALFGTDKSLDVLNKAAAGYFRMLEDVLFDDVLLHICRMTDPPVVSHRDTLTVWRLEGQVDAAIQPQVKVLLKTVETTNAFARDRRNRHISHRDLWLALDRAVKPLPPATVDGVRDAINAIAAVLNCVGCHYGGLHPDADGELTERQLPIGYEYTLPAPGDAEALLFVLEMGLKARDERFLG